MTNTFIPQYNQPQKIKARVDSLTHAVEILTKRREHAPVVPKSYVRNLRDFIIENGTAEDRDVAFECSDEFCKLWETLWESKNGRKTPKDLVVAYLAGPDPLNDFNVLVELGVHPYNIYAFESENRVFNEALENVRNSHFPLLKIINIKIEEYFQAVPNQFDIVYLDACGPLPSTDQGTLKMVASIFKYQRLKSPGVLITNFSLPDLKDPSKVSAYSDIVAAYLYPKGFLESNDPESNLDGGPIEQGLSPKGSYGNEESFHQLVKDDFPNYYGQFITRLLFDLAAFISPVTTFASSKIWGKFFSKKAEEIAKGSERYKHIDKNILDSYTKMNSADQENDEALDSGHLEMEPEGFAIGWALTALSEILEPGYYRFEPGSKKLCDILLREVGGPETQEKKVKDAIDSYLVIRESIHDIGNGNESDKNEEGTNKDNGLYRKDEMKRLLDKYNFMKNMHLFCDVPTSELVLYPLIAQGAFPMHYNVQETKRFTYIADGKSTQMFMDVIPFDSCRYIYDWLPPMELIGGSFDILAQQLVYRFALDGLVKHTIRYNSEFLFGAHVIDVHQVGYNEKLLSPRKNFHNGIEDIFKMIIDMIDLLYMFAKVMNKGLKMIIHLFKR